MSEKRLVAIETKIAFQEKAIKDLNDVLYEQTLEMQKLGATCDALVKRVGELSKLISDNKAPGNEKPPHY